MIYLIGQEQFVMNINSFTNMVYLFDVMISNHDNLSLIRFVKIVKICLILVTFIDKWVRTVCLNDFA